MQKQIVFIILCFSFCSSELLAQNLNLIINGATEAETQTIDSLDYDKTHKDFSSLALEVDTLHQRLIKLGYIESKRSTSEKVNDSSIVYNFQLNTKYKTLQIYYNNTLISKKTLSLISKARYDDYFSIPFSEAERVLNFINTQIANDGFPFSKIRLSDIKVKDNKTVTANLLISEGETRRALNKIVLKGYEKFPRSFLKRYLKIKPSQTFNIETIKKKIAVLDNLRFAKQIKTPEVLFTKDSTLLYLYIEKANSNTFDGFLGFSTDEDTNTLDFNGYLDLELNNNLNYGESLKLLYKGNENEEKNFEIKLNLPYLFGSPVGTELELNIFKKDSSFTTVNQKAKLFYQLNSKNRFYFGVDNTQSNALLSNNTSISLNDYKSNFLSTRYEFEHRNSKNALFQIRTLAQLEFGFGNRLLLQTKEEQIKLFLNAHHIFNLNEKNSIYIRLNASFLDSETYLENELIRLGGINSIRGFTENSLTATRYALVNTEYRYLLSNTIYAHSVIDYASLENKITNQKEALYGFGLGFGIITKAGLLKFNFANGKTENQQFQFSNSKIHLSLTSLF
ncbi:surface antigen (D15) [Lacinutrix sp. Hel_I_90]|uniref:surface antigen (D15) n=1 Tax=Lacinutrix sp. Hel_I_90 TaxID=1249999 RepID=UPI0005C99B6C|nr:surface antigen (D15) [Lacinutrix sp. Hel_I_90]